MDSQQSCARGSLWRRSASFVSLPLFHIESVRMDYQQSIFNLGRSAFRCAFAYSSVCELFVCILCSRWILQNWVKHRHWGQKWSCRVLSRGNEGRDTVAPAIGMQPEWRCSSRCLCLKMLNLDIWHIMDAENVVAGGSVPFKLQLDLPDVSGKWLCCCFSALHMNLCRWKQWGRIKRSGIETSYCFRRQPSSLWM